MRFTQIIDVHSDSEAALHDLARTWHIEQFGVAPGYEGTRILADRDDPTHFTFVVDFASEELANQNNDRPETQAWATKLRSIVSAEPSFHSTREVCSSYAMAATS